MADPRHVVGRDAAHRVHPLAGQGVNLGFGDVQCLTEILAQTVQNGGQLGKIFIKLVKFLLCYKINKPFSFKIFK